MGYASHRTAKLEEYKAKTFGTVGQLEGCKEQGLIKVEDDDTIRLGFGQVKGESSSSTSKCDPSVKQESDVKTEAEGERAEVQRGTKRSRECGALKAETKDEHLDDVCEDEIRRRRKVTE